MNLRNLRQSVMQGVGHVIFLALLLITLAVLLLMMPGIIIVSVFADLAGGSPSVQLLWMHCILASALVFLFVRLLSKGSQKSFRNYAALCALMLSLSILVSIGFELHFAERWAKRLIGETEHGDIPRINNASSRTH
jgi:hypothetical protein